jgi:hypothetical protein
LYHKVLRNPAKPEAIVPKWPQRIRGVIGMGLTWAVAWAAVGFVPRWIFGVESDLPFSLLFAGLGFIAGVIFSALLVLAERRRSLDEMSLPRFAAWGAISGLLVSAIFTKGASLAWSEVLAISTAFAVACGVSASGSLALARRAARRVLPDSRAGATEAELKLRSRRRLSDLVDLFLQTKRIHRAGCVDFRRQYQRLGK